MATDRPPAIPSRCGGGRGDELGREVPTGTLVVVLAGVIAWANSRCVAPVSACDYCDEGLPLYHKREADEYGLEGDQFIPCANDTEVDLADAVKWYLDSIGHRHEESALRLLREALNELSQA